MGASPQALDDGALPGNAAVAVVNEQPSTAELQARVKELELLALESGIVFDRRAVKAVAAVNYVASSGRPATGVIGEAAAIVNAYVAWPVSRDMQLWWVAA